MLWRTYPLGARIVRRQGMNREVIHSSSRIVGMKAFGRADRISLTQGRDSAVILGFSAYASLDMDAYRQLFSSARKIRTDRADSGAVLHHETYLSSFQNPPRTRSWLSCTHEDSWWARGHQRAPCQGPQAPGGLTAVFRLSTIPVPAVSSIRVTRLRESVDFERVLAQPAAAVNRYFALHGIEAAPQRRPSSQHKPERTDLSTGDEPIREVSVDNKLDRGQPALPIEGVWLGIVVPKRHARRAVTRSLLKRQIRANLGKHMASLPAGMWVVRLRTAITPSLFTSAASEPLRVVILREINHLLSLLAKSNLGSRANRSTQT